MLNTKILLDSIKSKNILIKLFLSYLGTAILAVILITTFLTYKVKKESIKDINSITELALSNISMLSTNVFESANKTAYEIYNNISVKNMLYSSNKDNLDKVYASQYINNLTVSNSFIFSVYVCNRNSIIFKTSQNPNFEEDYNDISSLIKKSNMLTPIPRQIKNRNGDTIDIYSVIFHTGSNEDKNVDAVVIVNINASFLYKQVYSAFLKPKQDIFLVDKYGNTLLHNDMALFANKLAKETYYQDAIKSAANSGYFTIKENGHNLIYSYVFDEQRKYVVFSSSEYNTFFSKIANFQGTIILTCIIILVFITVLSVIISYKLFTPINNVFLNIRSLFSSSAYTEKQMTEAKFISQAFSGLVAKLNNIESDSMNNSNRQRDEFMKNLLTSNNQLSESNIEENILKYKIVKNANDGYRFIILRLDNFKYFSDNNTKEAIDFQLSSIGNIACESLKSEFDCIAFDIYPEHIALILKPNSQKDSVPIDTKLIELLKKCQDAIYHLLNLDITVGISDYSNNISDIRERYNQAYNFTNYRLLYGKRSILFKEIINVEEEKIDKAGYLIDSALNAVRSNSLESYLSYINTLFSVHKSSSYERIIKIFFQLANSIFRIPKEFQPSYLSDIEYDFEDTYREIKSFETYEDLEKWFLDVFNKTNNIITGIKNIKTPDFIDTIIEFINENYADSNLSSNLMAEKLSITPQYFSKVFNERLGISFPEYINNVRLEKAKELLMTNPKLSSVKICNMVGYNNSTYFTTSFTKKFGISPGKFKTSTKYENLQ